MPDHFWRPAPKSPLFSFLKISLNPVSSLLIRGSWSFCCQQSLERIYPSACQSVYLYLSLLHMSIPLMNAWTIKGQELCFPPICNFSIVSVGQVVINFSPMNEWVARMLHQQRPHYLDHLQTVIRLIREGLLIGPAHILGLVVGRRAVEMHSVSHRWSSAIYSCRLG